MTGEPPGILLTSVPPGPNDFERGAVARLGDHERRIARLESVPSGPSLGEFFGMYRGLYMLRGLWHPGTSVTETPAVIDASGQSRTLTYNGNPTFNLHNSVMPYIDFDGTGDYLSRAHEAGLNVLGTETYVAAARRGITFGGWFWLDTSANNEINLMSKWGAAGNVGYLLNVYNYAGDRFPWLLLSQDGTAFTVSYVAAPGLVLGTWNFLVGRLIAGVSYSLFINGSIATATAGVAASIFSTTAPFNIGTTNSGGGSLIDGRCALAFLCAAALPDSALNYLFSRSRVMFGV